MDNFVLNFLLTHKNYVDFINYLAFVVWVGGLVCIKFMVFPSFSNIKDDRIFSLRVLGVLHKFLSIATVFVICLSVLSILYVVGYVELLLSNQTSMSDVYFIFKHLVLLLASLYFLLLYIKTQGLKREFLKGNIESSKTYIKFISEHIIPTGIISSLIYIILGVR